VELDRSNRARARANIRLALVLGAIAVGFFIIALTVDRT
jgi:hypothetical protein